MTDTTPDCSNCENDAKRAEEHALRILKRDETRTGVTISLCEPCLGSLLELDWITRAEPFDAERR